MSRLKFSAVSSCIFLMLSLVFYISMINKTERVSEQQKFQIEKQIALDLPLLDLPNELYKHAGNKDALVGYIDSLNSYLRMSNLRVIAPSSTIPCPSFVMICSPLAIISQEEED